MARRDEHGMDSDDSQDSEETCWICLDSSPGLVRPCKCPRSAHPKCLARWQLQSAGKDEERYCRFCNSTLPDWKPILTPANLTPSVPVVSVHYNGVCYRLRVKPGAEGFEQFRRQLHKITGMPMLECMQITFQCKAPDTAQELSFKGISAFDAAIHCAAVSAAERLSHAHPSTRRSVDSAAPGPAPSAAAAAAPQAPAPSPATRQAGRSSNGAAAPAPPSPVAPAAATTSAGAARLPGIPAATSTSSRPQAVSASGTAADGILVLPPLAPRASTSVVPIPPAATGNHLPPVEPRNATSFDGLTSTSSHAATAARALSATASRGRGMQRVDSAVLIDHGEATGHDSEDESNRPPHMMHGHGHGRRGSSGSGGALAGKGLRNLTKVREFFRRIFAVPAA
mmetsp:Transcript_34660/g.87720  ORF Transcript_34660/g.87720 Transcript_34660/m.87720 type:complete len:397 (-) Transcript_34660:2151-3341(-)